MSRVPGSQCWRGRASFGAAIGCGLLVLGSLAGCPAPPDDDSFVYNNQTDRTNGGASFVSAAACASCHPGVGEQHRLHGHAQVLKAVRGAAPVYPEQSGSTHVPAPPPSMQWDNLSYVVGGYLKRANFVNLSGFLATTGLDGVPTQYNLAMPALGLAAGFQEFLPDASLPVPYNYDCFRCHTTGAEPFDPSKPRFQDGRPGLAGTWSETGVQCEACHGPGSNHIPNPGARNLYVNSSAADCGRCHIRNNDSQNIYAADGFVQSYQQWSELKASGGHAGFNCTTCHDPHASTALARDDGIRNQCTACHSDMNAARHAGAVFRRGDYSEAVSCESCHMPYAARGGAQSPASVVGPLARVGDTRTHIFRINSEDLSFAGMLSADGRTVRKDAQGRAAVTVDFVCLRCHNGLGNVFELTVSRAAEIAGLIHDEPQ